MSAAYIDGKYVCYDLVFGRRRHYLSCRHETPRAAVVHTTGAYVSPLRSSGSDDGLASLVPLHVGAPGPSSNVEGRSGFQDRTRS